MTCRPQFPPGGKKCFKLFWVIAPFENLLLKDLLIPLENTFSRVSVQKKFREPPDLQLQ